MSAAYGTRECFVLDATLDRGDGVHCFVPVTFAADGELESIVTGLNFISTDPPERGAFLGVIHADGQEACDAWCADNAEEYERLRAFAEPRPAGASSGSAGGASGSETP